MIMLALTGSIGMGKSTVGAMFADAGIPLFDADAAVHALQGRGGRLVPVIEARFPGSTRDGAVDRAALSARVIGNPTKLAALEAIVHPAVRQERSRFIADHAGAAALMFDIPLLFETHGESAFDKVIVVSAPAPLQRERVLARPGMTEERLAAIRGKQMPDPQKRGQAHFVVDTGRGLASAEAQLRSIVAALAGRPGRVLRAR